MNNISTYDKLMESKAYGIFILSCAIPLLIMFLIFIPINFKNILMFGFPVSGTVLGIMILQNSFNRQYTDEVGKK